jgi:hypothetical protein
LRLLKQNSTRGYKMNNFEKALIKEVLKKGEKINSLKYILNGYREQLTRVENDNFKLGQEIDKLKATK